MAVGALFALCVAPTFISYQPYQFTWDDTDYLLRAIAVNRAFWSGDVHGLGAAMVSWHTPAMTLLGLPWGPMAARDAAGNCFFTLAAVIAFLASICLYMLLRVGVKPIFLVLASICVGASLGPYQLGEQAKHMHDLATRFLSDNLLAWTALAGVLLVPFEARTPPPSARRAVVRGILCASICSFGALTKVSFFYFVVLIVPLVLFIRYRDSGIRSASAWLIAFVCCSAPTAIYFFRYGRAALAQARTGSFGSVAEIFYVPLRQFLGDIIVGSPGLVLSLVLLAIASIYLVVKKRPGLFDTDVLALLIMIGFLVVLLAAPAKQSRYLFPAIVALPFLTAILISNKEDSVPVSPAALAAGLVFLGLLVAAAPTRHRPYQQSLTRAEAVVTQAARCGAKSILLASDSRTLNVFLVNLVSELSGSTVSVDTLAYQAMRGVPIQDDFRFLSESDMVVFQDARNTQPQVTNQRASEYEQYIRQRESVPIRVGSDVAVYSMHCSP